LTLAVVCALAGTAGLAGGARLGAAATDPCHDLNKVYLNACQKAYAACNSAPSNTRSLCLSELNQAMARLRGKGTATGATGATGSTGSTGATGSSGAPPPPVNGASTDVTPVTGTVLVNGKPLVAGERIPNGATVDTTNGTVALESVSPTGTLQKANFDGAVFKVSQPKNGVTQLTLKGGDFGVCSTKGRRLASASQGGPTTVVQSLWGNGHGQFETRGRYAAATVRGTWWNTQDRCDGTFIRVRSGVVAVDDLVKHKIVTVTAGHTYLAAKP
jgi:hypothetical protein